MKPAILGDEDLGLEWAISELRDSYRHDKRVDGAYSLAGEGELVEFLEVIRGLLGEAALGAHAGRIAAPRHEAVDPRQSL